jgi:beta-phosphoglucomutase-like phosphatase (HAD superfamily)
VTSIDAILFEPVGALADFPGGSKAYWDRVLLQIPPGDSFAGDARAAAEAAEIASVEEAVLYEDAAPALSELGALGVRLIAASSLSDVALTRFIERASLGQFFHDRWGRDTAGGVGPTVLRKAIAAASLTAGHVLFLSDTEAGLRAAEQAGVHPILMMNDPDEAMRLTACKPAGGIVSLLELPDFVRLVASRAASRGT